MNTPRLTNCTAQLSLKGDFSAQEEMDDIQLEKLVMIKPDEEAKKPEDPTSNEDWSYLQSITPEKTNDFVDSEDDFSDSENEIEGLTGLNLQERKTIEYENASIFKAKSVVQKALDARSVGPAEVKPNIVLSLKSNYAKSLASISTGLADRLKQDQPRKIPLGTLHKPQTTEITRPTRLTYARPKANFNGRYFPCFGVICPPLQGTKVFPLSPKQEKFHFLHATGAPLNHLDGTSEPDADYLDMVMMHMELRMHAWENNLTNSIINFDDGQDQTCKVSLNILIVLLGLIFDKKQFKISF